MKALSARTHSPVFFSERFHEPAPHQGFFDQRVELRIFVVHGKEEENDPFLEVFVPEQGDGLSEGSDFPAGPEEGGIHQLQQAVCQFRIILEGFFDDGDVLVCPQVVEQLEQDLLRRRYGS